MRLSGPPSVYTLLNMSASAERDLALLEESRPSLDELRDMFGQGWREQLVAAVACLFRDEPPLDLLWDAFDRGQLGDASAGGGGWCTARPSSAAST